MRHPERHLPTDQGRADLLAFCRRSLPGYLLRFRVSPQARLSGLNDRRPLLAPALHAEAKPRLLHAQEQFTQRRVFGVRRTQPACGRALHAAPIRQIPTAILRGCSGTGFLNDEAFRTATPASPTNRDIVCERKDIIHQSQAADAADLALGTFEQDGDHSVRPTPTKGFRCARASRMRGRLELSLANSRGCRHHRVIWRSSRTQQSLEQVRQPFVEAGSASVRRPVRAPNQRTFGGAEHPAAILQRWRGERTLSPLLGSSRFAPAWRGSSYRFHGSNFRCNAPFRPRSPNFARQFAF